MTQASGGGGAISLKGVSKAYFRGKQRLDVLNNISLEVPGGAFEALMGPSGSGKSTLLHLIAGLDVPTSGTVMADGVDIGKLSRQERAAFRASQVGFIFQTYNLMPVLTALENVELPLLLTRLSAAERKKRARIALEAVGLADRERHYPRELSGGQEQRVAIARAIVTDPRIIVADEPTGDLDRASANEILDLMEKLNRDFHKTIIMVTHDSAAAKRAGITRQLDKGTLV